VDRFCLVSAGIIISSSLSLYYRQTIFRPPVLPEGYRTAFKAALEGTDSVPVSE
jgi:hypothetical protein